MTEFNPRNRGTTYAPDLSFRSEKAHTLTDTDRTARQNICDHIKHLLGNQANYYAVKNSGVVSIHQLELAKRGDRVPLGVADRICKILGKDLKSLAQHPLQHE